MHINLFGKVGNHSCISLTDMGKQIHILYMGEEPNVIPVLVINPRYRPIVNLNHVEDLMVHKYIKKQLPKHLHWISKEIRQYENREYVPKRCIYLTILDMRFCAAIAVAHANGVPHPGEQNQYIFNEDEINGVNVDTRW